jgi:hypothetical protein
MTARVMCCFALLTALSLTSGQAQQNPPVTGSASAQTSEQTSEQTVPHAPSVAECRADSAKWAADAIRAGNGEMFPALTVEQLQNMNHELADCASVDKPRTDDCFGTGTLVTQAILWRYVQFVRKHNLVDQFIAEDAANAATVRP